MSISFFEGDSLVDSKYQKLVRHFHYVKNVCIRSFSGPYSVQMLKNTDHKNSEYGYFSRSVSDKSLHSASSSYRFWSVFNQSIKLADNDVKLEDSAKLI